MGNCIICGTSADGPICEVHQEDVVFEFEGDHPSQLTPGRFYRGTVDGYADFGVFVDIGSVTGLLHRSKLDRRLESLDWDVGDDVFVQVESIRENGDIDLGWSIRQSEREFRGVLVDAPDGDRLAEKAGAEEAGDEADEQATAEADDGGETVPADEDESAVDSTAAGGDHSGSAPVEDERSHDPGPTGQEGTDGGVSKAPGEAAVGAADDAAGAGDNTDTDTGTEPETADIDRVEVGSLSDRVGEVVRLEGEVVSVRQTSGPTVFEIRDETGVVDCAAFLEAGVRAYPEIEADDVVRLDGEVRLRRDEIQVETESLVALEEAAREAVETRMEMALDDRARPDSVTPLAEDGAVSAVADGIGEAAMRIRRAVLESRPVVVRHDATTDGYVAGAAIERAVLPLIEDEHSAADAVYHYFDRRPLEDGVYGMNDATRDATRMLGDRERHDEKLPLFVFTAAGSSAASADGLELLDIYGAPRVVLDGRAAAPEIVEDVDSLVTVEERTAATVAATVAAAVNPEVREDLLVLPAISYWDDVPESYVDLAAEAGVDGETARTIREAVALEAFYQSYEDKRELIVDLLFEKRTGLAEQVSEQFRTKLEAEVDTATANIEERHDDGATVAVLDTDAYTHQYDFPPTRLLLDELHRRLDVDAVIGVGTDELHVRTDAALEMAAVVEALEAAAPNAGVTDPGARRPKLEFLAGERETVTDAVVEAVVERIHTTSP